jgi:hypothetical protein
VLTLARKGDLSALRAAAYLAVVLDHPTASERCFHLAMALLGRAFFDDALQARAPWGKGDASAEAGFERLTAVLLPAGSAPPSGRASSLPSAGRHGAGALSTRPRVAGGRAIAAAAAVDR